MPTTPPPNTSTREFVDVAELPLSGVRVVDLSRFLAGPYAATLFGDLGADVIKVEALDRDDPAVHTAPLVDADSLYYLSTVRNKRSIRLNLKTDEGYALLADLCRDADIVVENYRRDVPAGLGLEYEDFRQMNERIVLCSVRSFAAETRMVDSPAYDSAVQAYTGLMSVTGTKDGPAARMGIAVADLGTGLYSAVGVLGALYRAQRTGVGTHIEVALSDAGIGLMALQLSSYMNTGQVMTRIGTEHPAMAPLRVFSTMTKDVLVMAAKDEEFARMCAVMELPGLPSEPRFASNADRVTHQGELHAIMAERLATATAEDWVQRFESVRVPCTLVRDVVDIAGDDDFKRTMQSTHTHPRLGEIELVRNPITVHGRSLPYRRLAPGWGEDTDEVLTELGLDEDAITDLRTRGVVS